MHPLARAALIGTARQPAVPATLPAIDALVQQRADLTPERRLLLTAGAWAVFTVAARAPAEAPELPGKAPADPRPPCSPTAAVLLESMLAGHQRDLLPLALQRLQQAGLRLPARLLPSVLDRLGSTNAASLQGLLGPRARWLAAHNPAWAWVLAANTEALPDDADERWKSSGPAQRAALLALCHRLEPERARSWMRTSLKQDRAAERARLLAAIGESLTDADEPLLIEATADRAATVRAAAFRLLDRLPNSALAHRLRATGRSALEFSPSSARLTWRAPDTLPDSWAADGIREDRAPAGVGPRTWWLVQLVGRIPPDTWSEAFGLGPEALLAAIDDDDWELGLALSTAALAHQATDWAPALLAWWRTHPERLGTPEGQRHRTELTRLLPTPAASELAIALLGPGANDDDTLEALLAGLPRPWSFEVGRAWLTHVRHTATRLATEPKPTPTTPPGLDIAGLALPDALIAEGNRPFPLPEVQNWASLQLGRHLDRFQNQLRTRQRLIVEIPL